MFLSKFVLNPDMFAKVSSSCNVFSREDLEPSRKAGASCASCGNFSSTLLSILILLIFLLFLNLIERISAHRINKYSEIGSLCLQTRPYQTKKKNANTE